MIPFIIAIWVGCYSPVAIDTVIPEFFNETTLIEQVEQGACFYGEVVNVIVESEYRRFYWDDGDQMTILRGKVLDEDALISEKDVYFWVPVEEFREQLHSKIDNGR